MHKKFVFFPKMKKCHWTLFVVVNGDQYIPSSVNKNDKEPHTCVLFFDSMKGNADTNYFVVIKNNDFFP